MPKPSAAGKVVPRNSVQHGQHNCRKRGNKDIWEGSENKRRKRKLKDWYLKEWKWWENLC